jgi:hypothetical protein
MFWKRIALVCLLFIATASLSARSISYAEVVREMCNRYDVPLNCGGTYYTVIVKDSIGWHIRLFNLADSTLKYEGLIRHHGIDTLHALQFPEGPTPDKVVEMFLATNQYDARWYDRYPYYGYPNWARDVVKAWKNPPKPTLLELDNLARAYTNLVVEVMMPERLTWFGLPYPLAQRIKPGQKLGDGILYDALKWADKALETYERIAKEYPDSQLFIGKPIDVLGNQRMLHWLEFSIAGRHELAARYLKSNQYSTEKLEAAKQQLLALPKDAVFVSNGDNDFFPLVYLQQSEKLRPDVMVVSSGLLNAPRYQRYLAEAFQWPHRLQLPWYEDCWRVYLYQDKEKAKPLDFSRFLAAYAKGGKAAVSTGFKSLKMTLAGKTKRTINLDLPAESKAIGMVTPPELILLEFILADGGKRPIVFPPRTPATQFLGLQAFVKEQPYGYVLHLTPTPTEPVR